MMTRPFSIVLAAALLLGSPGLGVQRALATVLTAPSAPVSVAPVSGMQLGASGASGAGITRQLSGPAAIGAASHDSLLLPQLRQVDPVLRAHSAAGIGISVSPFHAVQTLGAAAQTLRPAAQTLRPADQAPGAASPVTRAAPQAAIAASRFQETAPTLRSDCSGLRGLAALSTLFDGAFGRKDHAGNPVQASGAGIRNRGLEKAGANASSRRQGLPEPAQPSRKLSRSFKVGIVGAALTLTISIVLPVVASAFGWVPHSNYAAPALGEGPGIADVLKLAIGAVVMAPIAEELVFRGVVLGGIARARRLLEASERSRGWIPAILSAVIFAAVHETGDPVLFATRAIASLVYARVYQKEGIHASIALHGFNNAFAIAATVGYAVSGAAGGFLAALAVTGAGVFYLVRSVRSLKRDRADRQNGRIQPYPLNRKSALLMAGVLVLGTFLTPISTFASALWLSAAAGYAVFALRNRPN